MTPLLSQVAAEQLFAELIYQRVLELVDTCRLERLELYLCAELERLGCARAETSTLARTIVDRALQRLIDDEHRYDFLQMTECDCLKDEHGRELHARGRPETS